MLFWIIIAIIAALLIYFVSAAVKIRLRFIDDVRAVDLAYTFLRARLDFSEMAGKIYLFGIRIKRTERLDMAAARLIFGGKAKPKTAAEERPKKEKKKRKETGQKEKKAGLSISFRDVIGYLKMFRRFLGRVRVPYLDIDISGGFESPFRTGQATAAYWSLRGIWPSLMSHISFRPDFSEESIKIRGKGLVYIRMFHILSIVLRVLSDLLGKKIKSYIHATKKGADYGGQPSF